MIRIESRPCPGFDQLYHWYTYPPRGFTKENFMSLMLMHAEDHGCAIMTVGEPLPKFETVKEVTQE